MLKACLPLCLAALVATAHAGDNSPLTQLSFTRSLQAGVRDPNGKLITGTEVDFLVPHQGRLYAGTSVWTETDPAIPKVCQILVLDSPKGQWRVERQFNTDTVRCSVLREVTISADARGRAIAPVSLLLAAPDMKRGPVQVFCREDATGDWSASPLGTGTKASDTRALGLHRDKVTGIDRLFAGNRPLGVISGSYDPAAPGRIRWDKSAELAAPAGERFMGFCDVNGILYCASSRRIFQRTDGKVPAWKEVYFCEKEKSPVGLRGLTAVPKPGGQGEVLWFVALHQVRRLDPAAGFKETIELDEPVFLTEKLGLTVTGTLSAYNDLLPYVTPGTGETCWLFGFETFHPLGVVNANPRLKARAQMRKNAQWCAAGNGRYCIRHAQGANITYEVAEITDTREPQLVAPRTIAVSPFPEDRGQVLYFGGYDCNSVPSHNTGWIYRGTLTQTPPAGGGNAPSKQAEAAAPAVKPSVSEGGLFQRTVIPGFSEIRENMGGVALVDINKDGLTDVVATYTPPRTTKTPGQKDKLRVFLNQGGLRFEPRTLKLTGSKLTAEHFGASAQIPNLVDFNGDGFLDILVTRSAKSGGHLTGGNTLLLSQGKWDEFKDVSAQMGIANPDGYNRQSSIADVNRDGWLDIAIGCDTIGKGSGVGYPLQRLFVFKPRGSRFEDGHFEDIGGTALVPDFGGPYNKDPNKRRSGPGITLRDLDNDGALDLVQSYHLDATGAGPDDPEGVHEQKFGVWCWRNLLQPTGQFSFEKITGNGLATEGQMRVNHNTKRVEVVQHSLSLPYLFMADFANTGLLDILAVGPSRPGFHIESDPITVRYWKNLGNFQFADHTQEAGLDVINWTRGQWHKFWGVTTPPQQLRPPRFAAYPMTGLPARPLADYSLYYGDVAVGDFDNDGNLDFVLCCRDEDDALHGLAFNILFLNRGGGRFEPMPVAWSGLDSISTFAVAADLNNDGLLDLVCGAQPDHSLQSPPPESYETKVYLNTGLHGARENHWLRLRFSGVRDAELVGARVEVREPATHVLLGTRIVFSNQGYKSCNALDAHFGLGKRDVVEIKVTLLNGKTVTFADVRANRFLDADLSHNQLHEVVPAKR